MPSRLTHVDRSGRVRMVDVSGKRVTTRVAVARGRVSMNPATLAQLRAGRTAKGNVLATAHLAGVMAAKRTAEMIPLAHPLVLDGVDLTFEFDAGDSSVAIESRVRTRGRTGVEMEALATVMVAALTIYDMLKAVDRGMVMGEFALWEKRGGRSGAWSRAAAEGATAGRSARRAGGGAGAKRRARPGPKAGKPAGVRRRATAARKPPRAR